MSKEWKTGIFQCMIHTDSCVDNCICSPCQASRQCLAAEKREQEFSLFHCILASVPMLHPFYVCEIRRKVAAEYQIDEGIIGAIIHGFICMPCSLCQTHRELSLQGKWPGGSCLNNEPLTKLP